MRKIILILTVAFVSSQLIYAQGTKSLKMASKKFSEFSDAPFSNIAALEEAKSLIEEAFQDEEVNLDPRAWLTRGEIFYNSGDSQIKGMLLDPTAELVDASSAIEASHAYTKALEMADKKGDKKNAIKGLRNSQDLLHSIAVHIYQSQDYLGAYKNFDEEMNAHNVLKSANAESRLDDAVAYNELNYFSGLTAYYAKEYEKAIAYLNEANATGTEDGTAYQFIFESFKEMGNEEEGLTYLEEGREKYPDDSGLLFSEINYYLNKGELNSMISRLEEAYEKEPDNQSVVLTLGQVYDQLQVKSFESGDAAQGLEYFNSALGYYEKALASNPGDFDLNYSIGALYYNRAATLTPALNEVANDFSKEGEAKYNAIKNEMAQYFEKSLPYFLKADEANPESRNTLIALKEIMVRQDKFQESNEYKDRLEALDNN